jgi:hypothetical protein
MKRKLPIAKRIMGQVIYAGPHVPMIGLQYGCIFRDGIHESYYDVIEKCPAIAELFIPVAQFAAVRRELNFDIGRNMRGTTGKHVTFYQAAQNWVASQNKQQKPSTGVQIQNHA